MSAVPSLDSLRIELFADGADLEQLRRLAAETYIRGFTTNPTLMGKARIIGYREFAAEAVEIVGERPISFEVFSDDFAEMEAQARAISAWGPNVFVKVPVTDTAGTSTLPVIRRLTGDGVKVNVTAMTSPAQVEVVLAGLEPEVPAFLSVFAGRVADTGRDPVPLMREAVALLEPLPQARLIWASPRELLNIFQADEIGCHVITVTPDVLAKLPLVGKDLAVFSIETVRMFHDDARTAGFAIELERSASTNIA
ncbi:MAG TPA: transaldolase [Plantibacter sp.]|uniref:transaldolase n=1 Tax=Plantibacter sp. TaxID=1871045 RepID=UPI002BF4568E|nr:transaldolase [Plantibacter sp.]